MKIKDFSFNLPPAQVAQHPPETRGTARLMVMNRRTGALKHMNMQDFPDLIEKGTLVVFNNSRVRKARVFAQSEFGG
ncbi:S-adenosylmethionine:tRNA ribosyltransferase-isomerase, partial [Oceanispirochaeta sp.]|uniref:S-adenosylmethionine:tRNA ribosyltransferase-isomerase n=1 Tax=Oceanispirochaeta sp. TaxID=2035350 RepID=UPI00261D3A29